MFVYVCVCHTAGAGQGRVARAAAEGGPSKVPFLLKKSLEKPEDLHLIKQKYNFFYKLLSL
jgi:hypothetical protein